MQLTKGIALTPGVNRAKYAAAARRIVDGRWTVDADAGIVFGASGQPIGRPNRPGSHIAISLSVNGKTHSVRAHRVIWESVHGEIPDDLEINHINGIKDDNRLVNLEAVTRSENHRHAFRTGLRVARAGEDHVQVKLTAEQVEAIRCLRAQGWSQRRAARIFGISATQVHRITHNLKWRRVA